MGAAGWVDPRLLANTQTGGVVPAAKAMEVSFSLSPSEGKSEILGQVMLLSVEGKDRPLTSEGSLLNSASSCCLFR